MSTGVPDQLYQIFEEHLHSGLYDGLPVERFIQDVVDFYWRSLIKLGYVPQQLQEQLKDDLIEDVLEMLKVKIYGHFGISEYNRTRRMKSG